jgi:hypothetical protein
MARTRPRFTAGGGRSASGSEPTPGGAGYWRSCSLTAKTAACVRRSRPSLASRLDT